MQTSKGFTRLMPDEIASWLSSQKISRAIKTIQLHHTWKPDYSTYRTIPDVFTLQKNMKDYHVNTNKWGNIAQHFTVFPDGSVVTGRSLNVTPIGITGGNTGSICIENCANFDRNGDIITAEHQEALITLIRCLMQRFSLKADCIRYHSWFTASGTYLGDYVPSKSAKTCPGTAFFGGNTKKAFELNLKPLLEREDNAMTEAEKREFQSLKQEVEMLKQTVSDLKAKAVVYDYIDENMPDWCKPIVEKGVELGLIRGTSLYDNGTIKTLGLTIQDIKAIAYDLRERGVM